mmetsp:Transcript_26671/g.25698  ORF Transcript_26671/g.25698 Transcript_26671/m.25698 type:complete len:90 (-) Transcript_26671:2020-2289(-)
MELSTQLDNAGNQTLLIGGNGSSNENSYKNVVFDKLTEGRFPLKDRIYHRDSMGKQTIESESDPNYKIIKISNPTIKQDNSLLEQQQDT